MQGVILSAGTAQGTILGDDGKRYTYTPLGWRDESEKPQTSMRVDFEPRGSHAVSIYPIAGSDPHSARRVRSSSGSACRRTPTHTRRCFHVRRSPGEARIRRRRPNREIRPLLRLRQRRDSRWHGGTGPWREAER